MSNSQRHWSFTEAQADMRRAFLEGAPGVLVSGLAWLAAATVGFLRPGPAGAYTLLLAGMSIFPLSVALTRALGHSGMHARGNPLGRLAIEGTLWMLVGIVVAYGVQQLRPGLFFPTMLMVIGGRYLTFQTLYGNRTYWSLGGALCAASFVLAGTRAAPPLAAAAGAGIEIAFAVVLFLQAAQNGDLRAAEVSKGHGNAGRLP
jgi:hypothetical protein